MSRVRSLSASDQHMLLEVLDGLSGAVDADGFAAAVVAYPVMTLRFR